MVKGNIVNNNTVNMPSLSVGCLESYYRFINRIPILSEREERNLAIDFRTNGNLDSARQLIVSHLRLVSSVARKYRGYGLQESDLIQEGNIGLMKAVKRFDPEKGVRLVTFAMHWIKAEIHEFILKNWRIVKIATTKAQRKLFFKLRSLRQYDATLKENDIDFISETLEVKKKDVIKMEEVFSAPDKSVDTLPHTSEESKKPTPQLTDSNDPLLILQNLEFNKFKKDKLIKALWKLEKRDRYIIVKRWLSNEKNTLNSLGNKFNISSERVRQLEKLALDKLKIYLTSSLS